MTDSKDPLPEIDEAESLRSQIQKLKEIEALKAELAAMKGLDEKNGSEKVSLAVNDAEPKKEAQLPKKKTVKDGCLLVLSALACFIVFMVIMVIFIAVTKKDDSSPVAANATPATTSVENKTKSAPVDSLPQLTTGELCRIYEANEIAADEQYKGKEVVVIGPLKNISKDTFRDGAMVSIGDGFPRVVADFSAEEAKKLSPLHKEEQVAVRGTIEGKLMGIHMKDCSLINIKH